MSKFNAQELIDTILAIPGEDRMTEFKRLGREEKVSKVIESIVAMANTDGGVIIFGVDDPEKTKLKEIDRIFGIEENIEKYDEVGRNIARITPPIPNLWPPITLPYANNKSIGILSVLKGTTGFYAIDNHVFIRLERGNKILTPHEIVSLSYAKGFQRADRELIDVDFELLNTDYYKMWLDHRNIKPDTVQNVLFNTGLARKDQKQALKPTRAAALLFSMYPHHIIDINFFSTKVQLKQSKRR
jgi:ATP-dependent DNA helicase RecG